MYRKQYTTFRSTGICYYSLHSGLPEYITATLNFFCRAPKMYIFLLRKDNAKCPKAVICLFDKRIMISKYWFWEVIEYTFRVLFDEARRMDHNKWILYSGEESITVTALKDLTNIPSDIFPEIQSWTQEQSIQRTIEWEADFHYKLLLIKSKPYIIYYMGNLNLLDLPILWIVGPRMHSSYATEILTKLFALAPSYNFATISWLAPGVDQLCHRLSLEKGIPTIAVLGWWLKHFLSWGDRELIQEIVSKGGLILSEFKLFQEPQTYTFPQRNRIIAGLADLMFLPEAGAKSGSLITANFALDMGRPVYGVPNNIFVTTSTGINQLLASWQAQAVVDIQVFLESFFPKKDIVHVVKTLPNLSADEQTLVSFLSTHSTCSLTDFLRIGSLSSQDIISLLTLLEMKAYVIQDSPGIYKIAI